MTTESIFNVQVVVYRELELTTICTYKFFNITLELLPKGELYGNTTEISSSGIAEFNGLVILTENTYKIYASTHELGIFSIYSEDFTIENFYSKFSFTDKIVRLTQPISTESIFSVEVAIYYEIDMVTLCSNCSSFIHISLDNQGVLLGPTKSQTSCGISFFFNLQIISENNYTLKAYGDNIISSFSPIFLIKDYFLKIDLNPIVTSK